MKKTFIIWSDLNQIGFGVEVEEKDYESAKHLALEGFSRWNQPSEYPEYESYGWAEPSMELLNNFGIEHRIIDDEEMTVPGNPDFFRSEYEVVRY